MNAINKQIVRAQRRLLMGTFCRSACWSIFAGWIVAAIAIAAPKIWHMEFLTEPQALQTWCVSWIAGGAVLGLFAAAFHSFWSRETMVSTAVEVDRRYKLKERLSSAMSLNEKESSSNAGAALIADATKRADTIDVRDEFRFQPNWKTLLPLIPIMLCIGLLFVPNAVAEEMVDPEPPPAAKNKAKLAVEAARKKLKKNLEEMQAKGLKDAKIDMNSLEKKIDNLSSEKTPDKRDALIKLNDIKKQLEERRKELGGDSKGLKNKLKQMQDVSKGPGKELSEALNDGDFDEAKKAIKDLVNKLKEGKLNKIEKQQMIKNMQDMADQIEKMVQEHKKAQEKLKKKIQEAIQKGDMEQAAKMQQQLEKKQQQNKQMQKMKKMAQKMKKCANCMNPGNKKGKKGGNKPGQNPAQQPGEKSGQQPGGDQPGDQQDPSEAEMKEAAEMLEEMQEMMEGMGDDLGELEDLEDMMEDIDMAKNECQGQGGKKGDKPSWNDWAKGEGRGGGKRDRTEEETGTFKARVKARLQRGETVVTGNADGDNISGKTVSEARELIKTSMSDKTDPLENQKLPRSQREHVEQYFKNLRGDRSSDDASKKE